MLHSILLGLVFMEGFVRLVDVVSGSHINLDLFLFHGTLMKVPGFNHVAPNAALNFMLCSTAIALQRCAKTRPAAQWVGIFPFAIAYLGMAGYIFEQKSLYTVSTYFPMAFITAGCFFGVSLGILWADASHGFVKIISSGGSGGVVARRILPIALIVPVVLSWVRYRGEQSGFFGAGAGATFVCLTTAMIFGGIVIWTSGILFQIDTGRLHAEREMIKAREEAEKASEIKSMFLSNMSHEIRTPFNGIIGILGMLRETPLSDPQKKLTEIATSSANSLLEVINDILDISKIEAGELKIESIPFHLHALISDVASLIGYKAQAKNVRIRTSISADVPAVIEGDPHRLRQVLLNLLSNAVKFTDAGDVSIALEKPSNAPLLRIEVKDSGIGMDERTVAALFQPFIQADVSTTRKYGGTGLGLAISKELVELMGGRIGVTSAEGQGSTFWIVLPLVPSTLPVEVPVAPVIIAPPSGKDRPPQLRILLAEDNPVNQMVARHYLSGMGHLVHTANDGGEVLKILGEGIFDVIFMDCQMPTLDGYETTKCIRDRENGGRRIPIIAMTANAMVGEKEKCLAAGMDGYLSKPFRVDEVRAALQTLQRV